MVVAFDWVISVIAACVNWLASWEYNGIPFLSYLIGISITAIIMERIFG